MKRKNWRKLLKIFWIILIVFSVPILTFYLWLSTNINKDVQIEYGNTMAWSDLLKDDHNLKWHSNVNLSEMKNVGNYNFKISYLFFSYSINVHIVDTTSPKVVLKNIVQYIDEELPKAEDFVVSIEELSEYELLPVSIEKKIGEQSLEIKVKDQYGNIFESIATLTLLEYQNLPTFSGLNDIVADYGTHPDLKKNVIAKDERFGELNYSVDDSQVNYNQSGVYVITYTTSNPLGNSTTATRKITIKEKKQIFKISNFPTYNQYPNYPNGCESIALYTLLKYYNVNVTPDEIVNNLKKGSGPYRANGVLYGGDPEMEFVGDPRDKHGYGVFQKPIIEVANLYKKDIIDYSGQSLDNVLKIVQENTPVQVWASINMQDTKKCASWIHPITGKKIDWICNLHSVVIIGFDSNTIVVSDPYVGEIVEYDRHQFEKMYNLFGKRAIYYEK